MFAKKIIAFDIGKTKILMAVLKIRKGKFGFLEITERKNPCNPKKIEKIILEFCQTAQEKYWTKKVAVSAAHLVNPKRKIVSQGKACYGSEIFDFKFLEKEGFLVRVENDGRCFALGEYSFGKGRSAKNILTLSLGTEIGGGFILNGNNYCGSHNSSLEVSHISSSYFEPWTDWAGFCAGKGIENSFRRKTGKKISARNIFLEAKNGNPTAREIIRKAANILGAGIASLINILDPEIIIFGGSLSKEKKFINQAVKVARKNVFNKKANYKFAISTLGNRANLLGAASLFL